VIEEAKLRSQAETLLYSIQDVSLGALFGCGSMTRVGDESRSENRKGSGRIGLCRSSRWGFESEGFGIRNP
jgi:hypothetical protein